MDFLPFFVCAGLLFASFGALVRVRAAFATDVRKQKRPRRSLWLLAATTPLLLATGFCSYVIYYGFILSEPMASAACEGRLDEVRALLDRGASPDACTHDCETSAIACAADRGHADIVKLLLERGANPNARGKSALAAARANGHEDVVRLLEGRTETQ